MRPKSQTVMRSLSSSQLNVGEHQQHSLSPSQVFVGHLEKLVDYLENSGADKAIQGTLIGICHQLKSYGPQLEISHKDQMDRVFVCLRKASLDERLEKVARLIILEVIELRAGRWVPQDQACTYYTQKMAETEVDGVNVERILQQQPTIGSSQQTESPPSTPPMQILLPGEVIRSSGKYTQAAKIVGKNFFKDEVVIRNADSGKVAPGAKERLVQITGSGEDNIEHARQLMEETIVRNASPVRSMESTATVGETNAGAAGDAAGGAIEDDNYEGRRGRVSQSVVDAALNEFRYSVNVGQQAITITGHNLDLVRVAKLVLDEYFSGAQDDQRTRTISTNSVDDGVVVHYQESPRPLPPNRIYKREYLLMRANSPLCQRPPPNYESVQQKVPEIIRKVSV